VYQHDVLHRPILELVDVGLDEVGEILLVGELIYGWMVRRIVISSAHQSLNSRFDTLVSYKGGIFFNERRHSRQQRDVYDDFVNLKTHQISFFDAVSRRCL
jgi:hypothetical protein